MLESLTAILGALFVIAVSIFIIWLEVKIVNKAGFSGWWVLTLLVPLLNIMMIWVFAFIDWPKLSNPVYSSTETRDVTP